MSLGMKDGKKLRRAQANVTALRTFEQLERQKARVAPSLQR
jgi:hypothetical protein